MSKNITSSRLDKSNHQVELDAIKHVYQRYSTEMPDSGIDKQILAAAHRELSNPNLREVLKNSWWRRLLLPLYVTATFTFTAIGAHWYWPAPVRVPPGTTPGPVIIEIINSDQLKPQNKQRVMLKMPKKQSLMALPAVPQAKLQDNDSVLPIESNVLDAMSKAELSQTLKFKLKNAVKVPELSAQSISVEPINQAANTDHKALDKEKWVREIIQLLKNGDYHTVKKELVRFKAAFPDYPIDEQIEPFRH